MDSSPGLRLLCLDGGGIRGLSELIILKAIMDRVQSLLHLEKPPLPADYFDLMGGTSTGGLIAVLLGRLRMPIDEAIESYDKFSRTIFGKKQRLRDGKYSAKTFETIIKDVVMSKLGNESAPMRATTEHSCKSFVCTVSTLNVPRTRLFRSYSTKEISEHDCTIWEAVRATSAAPTYFSSIKIGPESRKEDFIDGGVGSNNPINELHEEAARLFPKSQEVACIVSLGTGVRNTIQVEQAHLLDKIVLPRNIIKGFKKLALDSERNAKMMGQKYAQTQGLYFRLSVEKGLEKIRLADWEKMAEVRTHTLAYLDDPEISPKVDGIARALTGLDKNDRTHNYTLAHLSLSTETVIQATLDSLRPALDSKHLHLEWLFPPGLCSTSPAEDQETNFKKRFQNDDTSYRSCEWFFETKEYSKLSEIGKPSVLWIKGPTGCGKSVQASVIIERLQGLSSDDKRPTVLYFYCHSHPGSTNSMVLVRALLAQSIQFAKADILREIDVFHAQNTTFREKDCQLERGLWDLLFRVISTIDGKLFIVVDGIDECIGFSGQPAERLMSLVARSSASIKPSLILLSSFDGTPIFESESIKLLLNQHPVRLDQLQMTPEFMAKDLEEFVNYRINDVHSPLRRKPQKTRDDVFKRICERANGIILYANLALEELKGDKISSVSAIRSTLDKLPDGLYEIYDRNLRVPRNAIKGAEAFCWVFASYRSLTWHELKSGLAIVDFEYSEDDLIEDSCELFIQHSCGQLVEAFGEQKDRIRFIHPNVQKFLASSTHVNAPENDLGISRAHETIACKLLACLKYEDLPTFSPFDGPQRQQVVETYSKKPGHGLLSYAVFNWYRHLRDSDEFADTELEQHISGFLMSSASISWLKLAMIMSYFAREGASSIHFATDVIDSLERWMRHKSRGEDQNLETNMRQWISDFKTLMLDWGALLERHPFWIHFIHYQFLPKGNRLRQIIEKDSTGNVIEFETGPISTKSSEKATWPDRCFAIDSDRDFAYVFDDNYVQCYHMRTDLLTAEMEIPMPEEDVPDCFSLRFKKGILCPRKRFLAAIFEAVEFEQLDEDSITSRIRNGLHISFHTKSAGPAWMLDNEANNDETTRMADTLGVPKTKFVIYLLQLDYAGATRTSLFNLPGWTDTPLIATSSQRIRWELDDLDTLAFSPDSSCLAFPNGILNLTNGKLERSWSYGLDYKLRSSRVTADFNTWAAIRNRNMIELRSMQEDSDDKLLRRIHLSATNRLLTISSYGRFILVLKVHDFHQSQSQTAVVPYEKLLPQQGTIGIFDCRHESWTPLLVLQPPSSQRLAPWAIARLCFRSMFSPEAPEGSQVNQVLVQIPAGWKIAPEVRQRTEITGCASPKYPRILIFESEKYSDGFGAYPTLKLAVPLRDARYSCPVVRILAKSADSLIIRTPISNTELRILEFTPDLKHVTTQSKASMFTRSVENLQASCRDSDAHTAIPTIRALITDVSSIQDNATHRVLLVSPERSHTYRIQVIQTSQKSWDEAASDSDPSMPSEGGLGKRAYQLELLCIRADETKPTKFTINHLLPLSSYQPPQALQYVSVTKANRLAVGNLELVVPTSNDNGAVVMKDAKDTVLGKALRSFERHAHPLKTAGNMSQISSYIQTHVRSVVKKDLTLKSPRYAIFQDTDISFENFKASNTPEEEARSAWLATGAFTEQAGLFFAQFTRPFGEGVYSPKQYDARQHEVFICLYDEQIDRVIWLMHTLSTGDSDESKSEAPAIAWAIHPKLPLLANSISGHRLRVSHIASERPPVNIAEPLTMEVDSNQGLKFSPSGRYLLAQAHATFKNAFIMGRPKAGDAGSIMVFDLLQGKSISLALTSYSLPSFDIDDEDLKIFRITRQGFVEMNKYKLPDLVEFERQHLTFLPADCRCATCGDLFESKCSIFVSEHHGIKSVVISHKPIDIGHGRANDQPCDPLILRVTAPSIPVEVEQISDTIVAIIGRGAFPSIVSDSGDVLDSAFDVAPRSEGRLKSVHQNTIDESRLRSSSEVWNVKDIVPIIHNYRDVTGVLKENDAILVPEAVEFYLQVVEQGITEKLRFGMDSEKIKKDSLNLVRTATKGAFPFDSWAEFREMMAETAEKGLVNERFFDDFLEVGNRGIGTQIPVFMHSFSFKEPPDSGATDFNWSAAMDIGWIEEDVERFFERFIEDKFDDAHMWYAFSGYADIVGTFSEIRASSSPEALRVKKYFGSHLQGPPDAPSNLPKAKDGFSMETLDEDFFGEVLESLTDMFGALSDLFPGMGKAMEIRLRRMMGKSILELED